MIIMLFFSDFELKDIVKKEPSQGEKKTQEEDFLKTFSTFKDDLIEEINISSIYGPLQKAFFERNTNDKPYGYYTIEYNTNLGAISPYPIPNEDFNIELLSTTLHELTHGLGLSEGTLLKDALTGLSDGVKKILKEKDIILNYENNDVSVAQFLNKYEDKNVNFYIYKNLPIYDQHLVSYWNYDETNKEWIFDKSKPNKIKPGILLTYLETKESAVVSPIVDVENNKNTANLVHDNNDEQFVVGFQQSSGVYFEGDEVSKVLKGALLGIPVNGVEMRKGNARFELAHFELAHSMLSHQGWSNYISAMEAELAAFKDLGYKNIDLRNYFGSSEYRDNQVYDNTNPYYARNENGDAYEQEVPNTTMLGVGLHIYGSNNQINQVAIFMLM